MQEKPPSLHQLRKLEVFFKGLLFYCILIILWGAFVRFSGSGDGCGEFWPLCYGVILPDSPSTKTLIEFVHRLKSGLFGLLVLGVTIYIFRLFPKGHALRKASFLSLVFTFTEALIGAKLVLAGLVADNDSLLRALVIGLHLLNTFTLLACLAGAVFFSRAAKFAKVVDFKETGRDFLLCLSLLLILVLSGSLASLSNSLFPSDSLQAGIAADLSANSHILIQLRVIHPIAALALFFFILKYVRKIQFKVKNGSKYLLARKLHVLLCGQVALGILTLASLSPVYLKLAHLLLGDLIWLGFCFLFFELRYRALETKRY